MKDGLYVLKEKADMCQVGDTIFPIRMEEGVPPGRIIKVKDECWQASPGWSGWFIEDYMVAGPYIKPHERFWAEERGEWVHRKFAYYSPNSYRAVDVAGCQYETFKSESQYEKCLSPIGEMLRAYETAGQAVCKASPLYSADYIGSGVPSLSLWESKELKVNQRRYICKSC